MITQENIPYTDDEIKAMVKTCEKYNKALDRADTLMKKEGKKLNVIPICKYIFPEFDTVSEDERIRKELIEQIAYIIPNDEEVDGEGNTLPTYQERIDKYRVWLEKQGEKKPADKITPKFKVGDFITNDYCLGKVIEITNDAYLLDTGQGIPFSCEHNAHLWTIEDAKDGDVLASNGKGGQEVGIVKSFIGKYGGHNKCFETYCYSDLDGTFRIGEYMGGNSIYPATKKQCDLLFQKMKEAGYEWDAEKKELKKFNVGDWITDGHLTCKVLGVTGKSYELHPHNDDYCHFETDIQSVDKYYRLWTIEDAKDGDVLDCEGCEYLLFKSFSNTDGRIKLYCWYNVQTNNFHGRGTDSKLRQEANIRPATKEQRDLLFQKMKEAGYEWDAEKKELKKIEVASKESKDERIRKTIYGWIYYEPSAFFDNGFSKEEMLAWVEKQGEQKSTLPKVWKYKKDNIPLLRDSLILNKYGCVAKSPSGAIVSDVWVLDYDELAKLPKEELEKQGDNKPTDKVDPKFNVGDWIVINEATYQITKIDNSRVVLSLNGKECNFRLDVLNNAHLWSIDDAKEGDILIKEETGEPFIHNGNRGTYLPEFLGAYCSIDNGKFKPNGSPYYWGKPRCPATKEQQKLQVKRVRMRG